MATTLPDKHNPHAKLMCWPCAAGAHRQCHRKRGLTYDRPFSVGYGKTAGKALLTCDCHPTHKLRYAR